MYRRKYIRNAEDPKENGDVLFRKLPESVLTKILSSIPTKDVVRTSILNKKWEFRWLSVYNLHFDDRLLYGNQQFSKEKFCSFVDHVLTHSDISIPLENFTLIFNHSYGPRITTWIAAAIRRKVQNLEIHHIGYRNIKISLPRSFFRHNSLQELRLKLPISFCVSFYSCFVNLKVLELEDIAIVNQLHDEIIHPSDYQLSNGKFIRYFAVLSFPKLERLQFSRCEFKDFYRIVIQAPKLNEFKMGFCTYKVADTVSIGCFFSLMSPDLRKFKYNGGLHGEFCVLPDPAVIVEGTFKMRHTNKYLFHLEKYYIQNTIAGLGQVKTLHLSAEVVMLSDKTNQINVIPTMVKIRTLKVSSQDNIPLFGSSLLRFLHKTPFVTKVVLKMVGKGAVAEEFNEELPVSPCVKNQLRKLKLIYSSTYRWSSSKDMLLLRYIVMNSEKLSEIEIKAPETNKRIPKATLRDILKSMLPVANNLDRISVVIN